MGYCLKDQEKWKKLKEVFPWVTEKLLTDAYYKYSEPNINTYILVTEPNEAPDIADRFSVLSDEFTYAEDLELYTWYSKDKWDGNPHNYTCVQKLDYPDYAVREGAKDLHSLCCKFMYIDSPS